MTKTFAEMVHHNAVRLYRLELEFEAIPIKRAKLITLIARAKTDAEDYGWPETLD